TGTEMGTILGCVRSTVSRLESGELKIDERQAAALDKRWNTGGHFLRLLKYAKLGHNPDWFREHMEFEAKASVLKICEPAMVPGLLQTEDYARAVFSAGGSSDVDSLVATRMARQEVVSRPNPPLVLVLLDEGAIDRPVGGRREVMSGQLGRLLDVSALPHVMLRIVPKSAGYHVGLEGAFKVLTVGSIDVAYTDAGGGGRLIMDAAEVRAFGIRFDRVGTDALSRSSTRTLIEQVRESLT
ncbi:MAG: transcriptional regulator, family, partial [Actinoallomurus sp.]|nr:transcriptional regulator, family [Actinoallomurus sp.]